MLYCDHWIFSILLEVFNNFNFFYNSKQQHWVIH